MRLPFRACRRPAAIALLAAVAAGCTGKPMPPFPAGAHLVEDAALSEMSGLEASHRHPGVLWSINDSGSFARLFRLGSDGRALGRVDLRGAWIRDSETLALWRRADADWILIGDVGDNRGWRNRVKVHALPEPDRDQHEATVVWTLEFSYPDGPRDAEGIAVDHASGDLLVLSKRDRPARLYRVPLPEGRPDGPVQAEFIASVPHDAFDGEVTGLDLCNEGRRLAVLTYRGLYLWERVAGETWAQTLVRLPRSLPLPRLRKAEAMAFGAAADRILVGSEKRPTPLLTIMLD